MKQAVRFFLFAALIASGLTPAARAASRDINLGFTVMQWINAVEIYSGKQIAERGENADVKAFAQEEVNRHTQWADDLVKFAEQRGIEGIDIEQQSEQSDPTISKLIELITETAALKDMSGAQLDKAFLNLMVKVHEFSLQNIQDSASRIGESEEATFLNKLAPQVQDDLTKAQELVARLGGEN